MVSFGYGGASVVVGSATHIFGLDDLGGALMACWDVMAPGSLSLSTGSQVSKWYDTKHGYEAFQNVGGSQPLLSVGTFPGGLNEIIGDGIDDELTYTLDNVFPYGSSPTLLLALGRQSALPADTVTRVLIGHGGAGVGPRSVGRSVVSGVNRTRQGTGISGSTVTNVQPTIDLSGVHLLSAEFGSTTSKVAADGSFTTDVAAIPATVPARLRIFASSSGSVPSAFWNGSGHLLLNINPLHANWTPANATATIALMKARGGIP